MIYDWYHVRICFVMNCYESLQRCNAGSHNQLRHQYLCGICDLCHFGFYGAFSQCTSGQSSQSRYCLVVCFCKSYAFAKSASWCCMILSLNTYNINKTSFTNYLQNNFFLHYTVVHLFFTFWILTFYPRTWPDLCSLPRSCL